MPHQWSILIGSILYDIVETGKDSYAILYKGSSCAANIPLLNRCVYEGEQVTVQLSSSILNGTLKKKNDDFLINKSKVQYSNCTLNSPSSTYLDNQIVREKDIVPPQIVTVYFDSNCLEVYELKKDAFGSETINSSVIVRAENTTYTIAQQKNYSTSMVKCSKGSSVIIKQKSGISGIVKLTGVYRYIDNYKQKSFDSISCIDGVELTPTSDCFITFDYISNKHYLCASAFECNVPNSPNLCLELQYCVGNINGTYTTFSKTGTTVDQNGNGFCNNLQNQVYVKKGSTVYIKRLITAGLAVSYAVKSFVVRNINTNQIVQFSETPTSNIFSFTMPDSDCVIETYIQVATNVSISPPVCLTVRSLDPKITQVQIGTQTYSLPAEVSYTIDGNNPQTPKAKVSWSVPSESYTSAYKIYPTFFDTNTSVEKTTTTHSVDVSIPIDMTLEIISVQSISCIYTSTSGSMPEMIVGASWQKNNKINSISQQVAETDITYYVSTDDHITSSGVPKFFTGQAGVTDVQFYTNSSSFSIGNNAFASCCNLQNVNWPSVETTIGIRSFYDTYSLQEVPNQELISDLGQESFAKSGITQFVSGSMLQEIADGVFHDSELTFVNFSQSILNSIGKQAFANCQNLHTVTISEASVIQSEAFKYCTNLSHLIIQNAIGVSHIQKDAFYGTWIHGTSKDGLQLNQNYNLYQVPNTTGIYFDLTNHSSDGLNSNQTLCTYIDAGGFLHLYKCNPKQTALTGGAEGWNYTLHPYTYSISDHAFDGKYDVQNFDMTDANNLRIIGSSAFKSSFIRTITMPSLGSVKELGISAFQGCKKLSEVYNFQKQQITKIPDYTFYNCGDDKYGIGASLDAGYCNLQFYIPDTITEIGDYAFANCQQLMAIGNIATCNITKVGKYAFSRCFNNTAFRQAYSKVLAYKIAAATAMVIMSVAGIAGCVAYAGAEHLLLSSIRTINVYIASAVEGGVGAAGIITETSLSDEYLRKQSKQNTAVLPLIKVSELGEGCFYECKYLSYIMVSDALMEIPDYCFFGCTRFQDIDFVPNTYDPLKEEEQSLSISRVKKIGYKAFEGCKKMEAKAVTDLLRSVEQIGECAFNEVALNWDPAQENNPDKSLIIPQSALVIGDYSLAFKSDVNYVFINNNPNLIQMNTPFRTLNTDCIIRIPFGTKEDYKAKFAKYPNIQFVEVALNHELWNGLKDLGYTIPWLNN